MASSPGAPFPMGSLAVLAMADNAPPADPAARLPVHPFFAQNRPATPAADKPVVVSEDSVSSDRPILSSNTTGSGGVEDSKPENPPVQQSGRRRKAEEHDEEETLKKPPPKKRTRNSTGTDTGIAQHFMKLGKEDENTKPNETESPGADALARNTELSSRPLDEADGFDSTPAANAPKLQTSTNDVVSHNLVSEPATTDRTADAKPTKPIKLLQFNPKTGTIGPPPKPKQPRATAEDTCNTEKQSSGRRGKKSASKIVRVAYGADPNTRTRLGELINNILGGSAQRSLPQPVQKSEETTSSAPNPPAMLAPPAPKPSKATHPFFMGQPKKPEPAPTEPKPNKAPLSPISARTKQYSSTPCSPRKASPKRPRAAPIPKAPRPQFGVKNLGLKFPGTKTPAWPWRGMVHVRGDESGAKVLEQDLMPLASRKSKGNAVKVSPAESVINLVADSLDLPAMADAVRNINTDEFIPPPPELRLPQKHFESGTKLQSRILSELRTFQPAPPRVKEAPALGEDTLPRTMLHGVQPPPQLGQLFGSIASSLSAFDMSQCETSNWVHKYAPRSAIEVLQPGQEAFFLRDWLQALTVQSVDTGSADTEKSKAGAKSKAAGAGKKKRRKKLDGFIVSSEDEDYEFYEPSDEDGDWAPSGSRGIFRKTIVRPGKLGKGKDGEKTANALVISGPHGCGKTAAVYAVAKELDFEVFEINPSSRRSGKDVLERIGDMTKNHHVRQQSSAAPTGQDVATEDNTAEDIKSGKQATMNAFFKPKTTSGPKPKQPAQLGSKSSQINVKKEPSKTQRQSLILLEEVDILFEEDKQFWTTIVSLITQAKRPFVITCNDETFVPLHTMRLHGIFRLSPPPRDLSVDRLILVAANEGHALTRESVEQLYDSRNRDLRAATMDLQYWCQMGVGDRRGGLDWFYPRWPKGADLDENKEVVRAVSQDTYRSGMNLLVRDGLVDHSVPALVVEEDVLHQAWESWGLDLGHWQDSIGLGPWAESLGPSIPSPMSRLAALEAYDSLAEAMSAADVCSSGSFAGFKEVRICIQYLSPSLMTNLTRLFQEAFDATQPEPSSKAKDDCVLGIIHLDTPVISHYNTLTTTIASSIKSLAKASLQLNTTKLQNPKHTFRPLDETRGIQCLHTSFTSTRPGMSAIGRIEFAFAFDPIAAPSPSPVPLTAFLEPSVFDRTLKLIVLDVAPYVRGIVAYDAHLQKQRLKMSSLVSEGGRANRGSKRMRTTRAALSAMEGGTRSTTRGERWFKADLNPYLVAKTAGKYFNTFETEVIMETPEKSSVASVKGSAESSTKNSPETSPDTTPTKTPREAVPKGRKRKVVIQEDSEADELGC